ILQNQCPAPQYKKKVCKNRNDTKEYGHDMHVLMQTSDFAHSHPLRLPNLPQSLAQTSSCQLLKHHNTPQRPLLSTIVLGVPQVLASLQPAQSGNVVSRGTA